MKDKKPLKIKQQMTGIFVEPFQQLQNLQMHENPIERNHTVVQIRVKNNTGFLTRGPI